MHVCELYVSDCVGSYGDNMRLTVNTIGLIMEVSPGVIDFLTVTVATLETPVRHRLDVQMPTFLFHKNEIC